MAEILDVSPEEYHLRPGLSASIATVLIERSPRHAKAQHPAYGGKGRAPTKATDLGSVVHAIVLGKGKQFAPVPFDDYRTAAARKTRDDMRTEGLVPLLWHEHDNATVIAERVREGLAARGIVLDGRSEFAIEWEEPSRNGPVLCRGMMDHVWLDAGRILDLKIVADASEKAIERSAERFGYAIQATAYQRALSRLRPALAGRTEFLFAFCETEDPYAMNVTTPCGAFREIGERRWRRAVETWGHCTEHDDWPDYGLGINYISPPAWVLAREEFTE